MLPLETSSLINLYMPLLTFLQTLQPLVIIQSLTFSNSFQHLLNSRHHTLQPTEVNVRTIAEFIKDLISVFLDLVLNVHLTTLLVLLLTGKSVIQSEVIGVVLLHNLPFVIVQQSIRVGNTKEEPCLSLVSITSRGVLGKQSADETSVGGNTSSGSYHDVIGGGVFLRHKHNLASRSSHHDLSTRLGVTEEVRADTLLCRIICLKLRAPIGCTTDTKRSSLTSHIVTITRRCNRVETNSMWLAILLACSRGHNTP
mmetsp:Transcript_29335/g.39151  ORF Transcript_29335/g.39151 Transcript_29335/m.39151 type:complete len:255 (-) Transcript_29335:583-1347(-)